MADDKTRAAKAAYMRIYNRKYPEKKREYYQRAVNRRQANPELAKKFREQRKLAARRQRAASIDLRLKDALRSRVRVALHGYKKGSRKGGGAVTDLGCSISQLIVHLENQFSQGMNWDNYGEWEIDHIQPLSKFDLTDRAQFREAANFQNLQPLWKSDNRRKGALASDVQ
jgi:hypothetical protein